MNKSLPSYLNPPVIEVVCGINFSPLDNFKAVHIGLLWEQFRAEFPEVQEQPPLATAIEQLGSPIAAPLHQVTLLEMPPLPRIWFLDKSGSGILQVQRDAFLHNWRKLKQSDQYPRFDVVADNFRTQYQKFCEFVEKNSLGKIAPIQCELTYINHIEQSKYWSLGSPIGEIFPDFAWRKSETRFLPPYQGLTAQNSFLLPHDGGRLYVSIQIGFRQPASEPLIVLEMKARGIPKDPSSDAIWGWFDVAHEWIVKGFADLTNRQAQVDLWGYKE